MRIPKHFERDVDAAWQSEMDRLVAEKERLRAELHAAREAIREALGKERGGVGIGLFSIGIGTGKEQRGFEEIAKWHEWANETHKKLRAALGEEKA